MIQQARWLLNTTGHQGCTMPRPLNESQSEKAQSAPIQVIRSINQA